MKAIRVAAASVLVMIVHSSLLRAQDAELPPPVRVVATFLQLSEPQVQDLVTMIRGRDAALAPIAKSVHDSQTALASLLETESPDPLQAGLLLIAIHNGEKQAAAVSHAAAASFADTLSMEQRQRMQVVMQTTQVAPVLPAFKALGLI